MRKKEYLAKILNGVQANPSEFGKAFAPANIALSKYWGKRSFELNLPLTSSLSISLGELGTRTTLSARSTGKDQIFLNGKRVADGQPFAKRLSAFLDIFRTPERSAFEVRTTNNIPTAAGLASSASGFAALVLALNDLFNWKLSREKLSLIARIGSGSATRSLHDGFVIWHAGNRNDGLDSLAEQVPSYWPEMRVGVLELSKAPKAIGSRAGMQRTLETSKLFEKWPERANADLETISQAIAEKNFPLLGETSESNALAMHATMIDSRPPLLYWKPESVRAMQRVWELRKSGLEVYFTMDAGPNIKLLFQSSANRAITQSFPNLRVVKPFTKNVAVHGKGTANR